MSRINPKKLGPAISAASNVQADLQQRLGRLEDSQHRLGHLQVLRNSDSLAAELYNYHRHERAFDQNLHYWLVIYVQDSALMHHRHQMVLHGTRYCTALYVHARSLQQHRYTSKSMLPSNASV